MPVRPFSVNDLFGLYNQYMYGSTSGDESGRGPQSLSEQEFNALPEQERMRLAGQYSLGGTNVYEQDGNLVGYGDPTWVGQSGGWYDPSGLTRGPDGRFSIGGDSVNWDAINDIQNATDRSGFFSGTPLQNMLRGAGIVLGAGTLANGFLGGFPGDVPVGGMLSETVPTDGLLLESIAPEVTETMVGSPWEIAPGYLSESIAPQVTEPMALNPFEAPIVNTGPLLEETSAPVVTEPMAPSPFDTPWWQDVLDLGRDILGGGSGGAGGGLLAMGGEAPRIGDHAQINDPYGLMASGWGPWSGLLDTPKGKVVDALAKRQRTRGI